MPDQEPSENPYSAPSHSVDSKHRQDHVALAKRASQRRRFWLFWFSEIVIVGAGTLLVLIAMMFMIGGPQETAILGMATGLMCYALALIRFYWRSIV